MTWQWTTLTIKEKLLYMMKNKEICDITVIVGHEKESFSSHSLLLSMFSDVLHTKILSLNTEEDKKISLPEEEVEVFRVFLKYIYTEEMELNSVEEAISCLSFSRKFNVKGIFERCIVYLNNNITINSILPIYEVSIPLKDETLKSYCWKYIIENISKIIKLENIKNIKHASFETMLKIVSEEKLQVESEIDIYNLIVKWGKENYPSQSSVDLRETLRPLLYQVRFLSMTSSQFAGSPCEDGILTKDEQLAVFKELCSYKTYDDANIEKQWRKRRDIVFHPNNPSIRSISSYYTVYKCSKTITVGKFPRIFRYFRSVKENINISGISVYIGCENNRLDNYEIKLSIRVYGGLSIECSYVEVTKKVSISEDPSEISVRLSNVVHINKGELFKIDFQSLSPNDYMFKYCCGDCSFRCCEDQLDEIFQPRELLSEVKELQNNLDVYRPHFSVIHISIL